MASSDALAGLVPILDAFNHRHRNQHRTSHWWPVFRISRRAIRSLSSDLLKASHPQRPPQTVHWLQSHIVPRAYVAFSQLAADNQHAPLGLLLLGVLARVHTVLTDLAPQGPSPSRSPSNKTKTRESPLPTVDKGVAISRDVLAAHDKKPPPDPAKSANKSRAKEGSNEKSRTAKRKKKKNDELSGLFGSLT